MTRNIWPLALACLGLLGSYKSQRVDAADAKSVSDESRVIAIRDMMEAVIRQYPSPKLPWPDPRTVPSFVIKDFSGDGVIELEDGRLVRLDGLICSASGVALLRRILLTPGTKVAIEVKSDTTPVGANVWTVEEPTKSYAPSFVGDFAVTSGACMPDASSSDNIPRYTALLEGIRRINARKR